MVGDQSLPVFPGRLLVDPPHDGPWNMAADEILLENADAGRLALRFYGWREATLSLGYFQRVGDRYQHVASCRAPLVRRASGGGAIVHDVPAVEITYSLAIPQVARRRATQDACYRLMHETAIAALLYWNVTARRCAMDRFDPQSTSKPFLCFQRLTAGDVLIDDQKVMGSAQRRGAAALLQHGSLLLKQSASAPELPGVQELTGAVIDTGTFRDRWLETLGHAWAVKWTQSEWSEDEVQRIASRVREKFGADAWNSKK